MIIREESDESLFYDFTPVSMISDRGDFYFRDWMNSLSVCSVCPVPAHGQTRRFGGAACARNPCRPLPRENRCGEKGRPIAVQ